MPKFKIGDSVVINGVSNYNCITGVVDGIDCIIYDGDIDIYSVIIDGKNDTEYFVETELEKIDPVQKILNDCFEFKNGTLRIEYNIDFGDIEIDDNIEQLKCLVGM